MKSPTLAFILSTAALVTGCGTTYIKDLPLSWEGVDKLKAPHASVSAALAAVTIEPGEFKDTRNPAEVVGTYEEDGFKVVTKGDVRAFWAGNERKLLEAAGAKFQSPGAARLDATLLQLDVLEGGTYAGTARVNFTVTRPGAEPWSKGYEGHSKRWGRSHSAENFDEALSNSIADATQQLLQDPAFAAALEGRPIPATTPDAKAATPDAKPADSSKK